MNSTTNNYSENDICVIIINTVEGCVPSENTNESGTNSHSSSGSFGFRQFWNFKLGLQMYPLCGGVSLALLD